MSNVSLSQWASEMDQHHRCSFAYSPAVKTQTNSMVGQIQHSIRFLSMPLRLST